MRLSRASERASEHVRRYILTVCGHVPIIGVGGLAAAGDLTDQEEREEEEANCHLFSNVTARKLRGLQRMVQPLGTTIENSVGTTT